MQTKSEQQPGTTFPTVGDVLALLGIFFVTQAVVILLASLVVLLSGCGVKDLTPEGQGIYLAATTFCSLVATSVLYVWYRHSRGAAPLSIGFSVRGLRWPLLLWAFVLMAALGVLFEPLYEWLPQPRQEVGRGLWSVLGVVVFAPVLEEFLCRGYLLGSLRERYGATRAVLFSALFFGILHVQPVAMLNAFLMGVVLGVVYLMTRTLWAPMLLHAANNAVAYLLICGGLGEATFSELLGEHRVLYALFYALSLVVCGWSAFRLWQELPHRRKK